MPAPRAASQIARAFSRATFSPSPGSAWPDGGELDRHLGARGQPAAASSSSSREVGIPDVGRPAAGRGCPHRGGPSRRAGPCRAGCGWPRPPPRRWSRRRTWPPPSARREPSRPGAGPAGCGTSTAALAAATQVLLERSPDAVRPRRRTAAQANALGHDATTTVRCGHVSCRGAAGTTATHLSAPTRGGRSRTWRRHEPNRAREDHHRHPGPDGPAALVALALAGRHRARHRLDPGRPRGHDRRLDRRPADREGQRPRAASRVRSESLQGSTSQVLASAPCSSATSPTGSAARSCS